MYGLSEFLGFLKAILKPLSTLHFADSELMRLFKQVGEGVRDLWQPVLMELVDHSV